MSSSRLMSFYDHVPITPLTGIANQVKSDTSNHANKVVSLERYDQLIVKQAII